MRQKVYILINSIMLIVSAIIFTFTYIGKGDILFVNNNEATVILIFIVILVYLFKGIRLYLALYGTGISINEHIKQYCKTVPVSILIPFKAGDIFRAYCYGYKMQNYLKAIIIILLDRFIDTLALVTITFLIIFWGNERFPVLFYLLLIFLILIIVCYYIFPELYAYWNRYFLKNTASIRRNFFLKLINRCNIIYLEVTKLIKGRCLILYFISILAWSAEIGGLIGIKKILSEEVSSRIVIEYLNSALVKSDSVYLQRFVFFSILLMIIFYLIPRIRKWFKKEKSI